MGQLRLQYDLFYALGDSFYHISNTNYTTGWECYFYRRKIDIMKTHVGHSSTLMNRPGCQPQKQSTQQNVDNVTSSWIALYFYYIDG